MRPLVWDGSLVDSIYRDLILVSIQPFLSFGWVIQPIYIRVIIDKYDPVAIYFVVLGSSL